MLFPNARKSFSYIFYLFIFSNLILPGCVLAIFFVLFDVNSNLKESETIKIENHLVENKVEVKTDSV